MDLPAWALHLPLSPLRVPIILLPLRLHCGTQPPLLTPPQIPAENSTLLHHQAGHLQDWPEPTDPPWAGGRSWKKEAGGGRKAQRGTLHWGEQVYKKQVPGTRQIRTEPSRASINGITSITSIRDPACLCLFPVPAVTRRGGARQPLRLRWRSDRVSRLTACWCMTRFSSSTAGCSANLTWRKRGRGRPEREVSRMMKDKEARRWKERGFMSRKGKC